MHLMFRQHSTEGVGYPKSYRNRMSAVRSHLEMTEKLLHKIPIALLDKQDLNNYDTNIYANMKGRNIIGYQLETKNYSSVLYVF